MESTAFTTSLLVILLLINSCVAVLLLSFVPNEKDRHQNNSLVYFKAYFICAAIGYLFYVYRDAMPLVLSVAGTNLFLICSGYCVVFGLSWRYKQERHMYATPVTLHIGLFTLVQSSLAYFYPDFATLRLALIYINLPAVLLYALSLFSRFKDQTEFSELLLKISFFIVLMNIVLMPVMYFSANSEDMYVWTLLLCQNITIFFMFGALFYTSLSDRLTLYKHISSNDMSTGLLNRRYFLEQATGYLHAADRHQFPISVLICELDNFVEVSQRKNHIVADQIIQQTAKTIRKETRLEDLVCRLSGHAFAVLLPQTRSNGAVLIAERMRIEINQLDYQGDGSAITLSASFGVASITQAMDIETGLNQADAALRIAKEQGGNKVEQYRLIEPEVLC